MAYKNPVPSLDDKYVSKKYSMTFTFPEEVDRDEAAEGIQRVLDENGGRIKPEWVHMGEPKTLRLAAPQN